jgi:hypothetical protein
MPGVKTRLPIHLVEESVCFLCYFEDVVGSIDDILGCQVVE